MSSNKSSASSSSLPALSAHCGSFTHIKESQFAEDLIDVENEDGNIDEQVTDIGEDDLDSYVNKGISTNGSKKKMALGHRKTWEH
jgi:hypothetical protein